MKLELEKPHFSNPFFEELSERVGDVKGVLIFEINNRIKRVFESQGVFISEAPRYWNFGMQPNTIVIYPTTFQSFLLFQGFDLKENRYGSVTDGEWMYSNNSGCFEKVPYTGKGLFYEIPEHCRLQYPKKSRVLEDYEFRVLRIIRET